VASRSLRNLLKHVHGSMGSLHLQTRVKKIIFMMMIIRMTNQDNDRNLDDLKVKD
jgi:hypothetical protein